MSVWKTTKGQLFQNYRSVFTVLDIPVVPRAWLNGLNSSRVGIAAPPAWKEWVDTGRYRPLASESTTVIRDADTQMPDSPVKKAVLRAVYEHYKEAPIAFEGFADRGFQMHDPRVIVDGITRGVVDGGRDAFGRYGAKPVTVGVEDVSRLISRIRHRRFGILVTTSVVARQAYQEVREDRHPILFDAPITYETNDTSLRAAVYLETISSG